MEIDVKTTVYRGDPNDFNVIAEIPGTDLAHEIVIVGGHLQSLPHGTGAIDNAAGSTTSMEAVRILKAIGARPRRTIRVGLWGGHDGVCRCRGEVARRSPPRVREPRRPDRGRTARLSWRVGKTVTTPSTRAVAADPRGTGAGPPPPQQIDRQRRLMAAPALECIISTIVHQCGRWTVRIQIGAELLPVGTSE